MATSNPENKQEGIASPEASEKDVGEKRKEYKGLLAAEKSAAQGRESATSTKSSDKINESDFDRLSSKDVAVLEKWLESPDNNNQKALTEGIANFKACQLFVGGQMREFKKELDKLADAGIFSRDSIASYLQWFKNDLSAKERSEYLKNKSTDAHNPVRKRVLQEANKLFDYFADGGSKQAVEAQRKGFLNKDLQGRQQEVADMKKKQSILEASHLPEVMRNSLKGAILEANSPDAASNLIRSNLEKHNTLKNRFLELPPLVQKDTAAEFKKMNFAERAKFLDNTEQKVTLYTSQYSKQIEDRQQPDSSSLTLFSTKKGPGNSEDEYLEVWFKKKLTLDGMRAAVENSDLKNPERETVRTEMRKQLIKIPGKARPEAIKEFNEADLDRRKILVKEWGTKAEKPTASSGDGNIVQRLLRRIIGSSANTDVERKMKTWTVIQKVAEQKRRYRLGIGHNARTDIEGEAAEKGETTTIKHTQKVVQSVHSERLKTEKEGELKLKASTLETEQGALTDLTRALKPTVTDPNAMIASNVHLRTETDEEVIDENAYMHGAQERQLDAIKKKITPLIMTAANLDQDVALSDEQIQKELDKAKWDKLGDEIIQRAA